MSIWNMQFELRAKVKRSEAFYSLSQPEKGEKALNSF